MKLLKHLVLLAAVWCGVHSAEAQTWTQTSAPSENWWSSVASSADGNKLIAVSPVWIYLTSTNSGATWVTNTQPQKGSYNGSWSSIASSADGTILAGINFTAIWVSTNSGLTWFSNNVPGAVFFASVAMSADGNQLVVADGNINASGSRPGLIYTSTNWGVTMTPTTAPTNNWTSVASSADGTKLVAVAWPSAGTSSPGSIYTSTNAGRSWTYRDAPNTNLAAVASSADGNKLVAAGVPSLNFNTTPYTLLVPGLVYTSTNSGMTWASNNVPDTIIWDGDASSADGSRLVAVGQGGDVIYTSTNSGATWISNSVPNEIWYGVASSADGNKLAAIEESSGGGSGGIWTSQTMPSPQLNLTPSPTNLTLAWTVPSTNFVLQQSTDLVSWSVVTNPPVLNLTNLQNQVTLATSNASGFYRLKTP